MSNNHNETIYTNSGNQPVFAAPEARPDYPLIPEDDRITAVPRSDARCDWALNETHRERSVNNALQRHEYDESVTLNRIDPGCLSRTDQIVIETRYSVYHFTVTDPTIPSGKLIGGILGNRLVDAQLMLLMEPGEWDTSHKSLKVGARFIFLIDRAQDPWQIITSRVTSLVHRKDRGSLKGPTGARLGKSTARL